MWVAPLLLLAVVASASSAALPGSVDRCHLEQCRAGRECRVVDGQAECACVARCPAHDRPVCGSDGQSYNNICRLHQNACITGVRLRVDYRGYCKADIARAMKEFGVTTRLPSTTTTTSAPTTTKSDNLAVCYGPQRDALRDAVIDGWQRGVAALPWYAPGMSYKDSLSGHFFSCDVDRDYKLRPDELLDCFSNTPFSSMHGQDQLITKTLCIDALVEDVDQNKDWRLTLAEFSRLLDPLHRLQARNCSLEGKHFTDGEEVHVECNHCVCATGSWVCATRECPKKEQKLDSSEEDDEEYYEYYDDKEFDRKFYAQSVQDQTKKEIDWLTPEEKKELNHLEENIKKFYNEISSTTKAPTTTTTTTTTTTEKYVDLDDTDDYYDYNYDDSDEDSEQTPSEEKEDLLLDQYDDIIDKSDLLQDKMRNLREMIRNIESKRAERKIAKESSSTTTTAEPLHENSVNVDATINELTDHKARLLAKFQRDRGNIARNMERNRLRTKIDNDIWEDQWKAKVKKHRHNLLANHI